MPDCLPGGDLGGFRAASQSLKVEDIIIAIGDEETENGTFLKTQWGKKKRTK